MYSLQYLYRSVKVKPAVIILNHRWINFYSVGKSLYFQYKVHMLQPWYSFLWNNSILVYVIITETAILNSFSIIRKVLPHWFELYPWPSLLLNILFCIINFFDLNKTWLIEVMKLCSIRQFVSLSMASIVRSGPFRLNWITYPNSNYSGSNSELMWNLPHMVQRENKSKDNFFPEHLSGIHGIFSASKFRYQLLRLVQSCPIWSPLTYQSDFTVNYKQMRMHAK
jgi:hypothetical protein